MKMTNDLKNDIDGYKRAYQQVSNHFRIMARSSKELLSPFIHDAIPFYIAFNKIKDEFNETCKEINGGPAVAFEGLRNQIISGFDRIGRLLAPAVAREILDTPIELPPLLSLIRKGKDNGNL